MPDAGSWPRLYRQSGHYDRRYNLGTRLTRFCDQRRNLGDFRQLLDVSGAGAQGKQRRLSEFSHMSKRSRWRCSRRSKSLGDESPNTSNSWTTISPVNVGN